MMGAMEQSWSPPEKLMRYSAWANGLLHESLAAMDPEVLARPRPGRPAGVPGVLGHIYVVAAIWKGHLLGQPHGFRTRALDPLPPLAGLRTLQAGMDQWYCDFAAALPASRQQAPIDFRFVDGGPGRMSAEEMLLHVANHGTYHRGYIADMLYEAGVKPPTMDLPVYIRDVLLTPPR